MNSPIAAADEPALVRKARWGDHAAFDELYRLHAAAVYTLAYRLTGNAATAEDITQETFLRMLQFLGGFKEGLPLRPWLKRVASNAAIDRLRRDRHHLQDEVSANQIRADAGTAASAAEASSVLRRLPHLPRTLVWLHEMEGWTHAELAARFGQSPSWSKSIVSRSLARLRDDLEQPNTGDSA